MHRHTQKKLKDQPLSRLGLKLAEEEREQKDGDMYQLLVAQLQFDRQRNHWILPLTMLAGLPTVEVGFGGNAEPGAVSVRLLGHLTTQMPLRRGLPGTIRCCRLVPASQFQIKPNAELSGAGHETPGNAAPSHRVRLSAGLGHGV